MMEVIGVPNCDPPKSRLQLLARGTASTTGLRQKQVLNELRLVVEECLRRRNAENYASLHAAWKVLRCICNIPFISPLGISVENLIFKRFQSTYMLPCRTYHTHDPPHSSPCLFFVFSTITSHNLNAHPFLLHRIPH